MLMNYEYILETSKSNLCSFHYHSLNIFLTGQSSRLWFLKCIFFKENKYGKIVYYISMNRYRGNVFRIEIGSSVHVSKSLSFALMKL